MPVTALVAPGPEVTSTHAHSPGRARIAFGHVHRALFVPYEIVRDPIARPPQFVVDVKHCATRIAEDRIDALGDECRG